MERTWELVVSGAPYTAGHRVLDKRVEVLFAQNGA